MDIICELNKVDFFESSKEYPKFKDSKIEHGFELEIPDNFDVHHVRQVHGNNIIELHKSLPGKTSWIWRQMVFILIFQGKEWVSKLPTAYPFYFNLLRLSAHLMRDGGV